VALHDRLKDGHVWGPNKFEEEQFMSWGDDINSAIARRDTTALRRNAERARRKEGAMFLSLVAELVELELRNTTQLNKKSA
jgi:hypothetical protein